MRLDLLKDFKTVVEQFLTKFIVELSGSINGQLEQIILVQGAGMIDKLLYFCCSKNFFGLKKGIYNCASNRDFVIITQNKKLWKTHSSTHLDSVLKLKNSLLISNLQTKYKQTKIPSKQVVSFIVDIDNLSVLFCGIVLNKDKQNQTFYIWAQEFITKANKVDNIVVWNDQRLMYKNYYQGYLDQRRLENADLSIKQYIHSLQFQTKAFQQNFKKYIGTTFYDYHIQDRLLEAVFLLMFTSLSVTEIAFKCGYDNYRTFLRAFTKNQGYTPLEYKSLQKE
ncbi:MAG: helix-turn-helix domain-containing protein [Flavobacterium sp.]